MYSSTQRMWIDEKDGHYYLVSPDGETYYSYHQNTLQQLGLHNEVLVQLLTTETFTRIEDVYEVTAY